MPAEAKMDYKALKDRIYSEPAAFLQEAGEKRMNFSQYSNYVSPDSLLKDNVPVTQRLWQDEGLFLRSSPFSPSTPVDDFRQNRVREVLLHDLIHRTFNNQSGVRKGHAGSVLTGFDDALGSALQPGSLSTPRVDTQVAPSINIGEIIAMDTNISGMSYKPFRWTFDGDALNREPILPANEIPATSLTQKEGLIELQKWGNRFRLSYEALRSYETRVDKLVQMVQLEALQDDVRRLNQIVGVLEKGDGTTDSAATVVTQSSLDSAATTGQLSAKAWLAFGMEFDAPYVLSHALMRKDIALQLILLTLGNANIQVSQLINANAEGVPRLESMNVTADAVRYGRVPDSAVSANYIIGFDSRFTVEQVSEMGADIQEQARNITAQTEDMVVSSTYNYAKLEFNACKILNIGA